MDGFSAIKWFGVMTAVTAPGVTTGWAQPPTATTNVGPGRIICRGATSCELGIRTPASLKYRIDPTALAAADKDRLIKRYTARDTPCVVTGDRDQDQDERAGGQLQILQLTC